MKISIKAVQADITKLAVDAIVNAANQGLLGGGGVDGAIHRAAGPKLKAYCATLGGCQPGYAKITPGFELPSRYIIHTVGPVWQGGQSGEASVLADCYRNSLQLAEQQHLISIAFPAISCGVFGYPVEQACAIAAKTLREASKNCVYVQEILLCAFSMDILQAMQQAIEE
ncbi:O-acetyl-ADP-ribose deacetylase [Aliiglaciecola sp. CAU 1673]|uniref:O-acetyl-ADP-ribose deacetylase n=1 Tax=Aliiglaciecola sp. CAU 1673 TaxID=3032595 RepID=UPI0023DAD7A1|nr:O-acetyl-ADP-ribose deacetylase [Aliiglaciecola sp. CAU 1673]MDF2179505.1 O-acetyl-ADP-ribose deacetylase [Aliiglaciecola sp. CAU 1673]